MKDVKTIELKEWVVKAGKLRKKQKSYDELRVDCDKKIGAGYWYIFDDPLKERVIVLPRNIWEGGKSDRVHPSRDCPCYKPNEKGELVLIDVDVIIAEVMPLLKKHIDVDALLEDTLLDQEPDALVEIHERLTKPKKPAKVSQKPGCVFLSIGGKPGKTFDLFLRT